jgi:hypothetical protein
MTKKLAAVVAFVGMSWAGSALAAEALLIRHEVLTVPIGAQLTLKPGFFIGKAWTADGYVADTTMNPDMRGLTFTAKAPGRTVVTAYNLREPNKRVEFEVVVADENEEALTPSLLPSETNDVDAPAYEPINANDQQPATSTDDDTEEDMDPMN